MFFLYFEGPKGQKSRNKAYNLQADRTTSEYYRICS